MNPKYAHYMTHSWPVRATYRALFINILTLIPPWISNHMPCKMWYEIIYSILKLQRLHHVNIRDPGVMCELNFELYSTWRCRALYTIVLFRAIL